MDTKQIKALMSQFDESGLSRMKLTQNDFSIELEKNITSAVTQVMQAAPVAMNAPTVCPPAIACPEEMKGDKILSPMVGTFYSSPSPDSPSFAKVGDIVRKGQVIAILEAMKIMNELEAEFDCKILDVLLTNGQAVEYDMPLFIVEKV
ncbi:MAG: acetyl-CoA carboxylase biotin carboxyl carrier protein [Sulfurimonadaceae bacterium]|jgi:acetyl-CoA carboxylase biotin carboxyl carrier protein|nr:acetyl-CoA carboxylase biotin carboxyl carrier protein [Sulfurimonadaceae bacterium]